MVYLAADSRNDTSSSDEGNVRTAAFGVVNHPFGTVGIGCMRLSTQPGRDEAVAVDIIHAALDAGATFLDTANVYCHDDADRGHNERLIATALANWNGDRSTITVATKGGLTRPGGKWIPDGRAKALRAACAGSRDALGVERIDLYQLHAVDPKTPFLTSIRALAALMEDGLVARVGLCNVDVGQIKAAREIVDIASVQVELHPLNERYFRNGVAEFCRDHDIPLIAARPLGGERVKRVRNHPALREIAKRHAVTPEVVALAWLQDLWPGTLPIPGVTRAQSARALGSISTVPLSDSDRELLDREFPAGRLLRVPRRLRAPSPAADGDVVMIMGSPGAGKTQKAHEFVARGYQRLNRDEVGGSLSGLIPLLARGIESGRRRWVMDNTYPTREARNQVIECAWTHRLPVRCIWLESSVADAQINVIARMIQRLGRLPMPEELRKLAPDDPAFVGPDALFRYQRTLEEPTTDEGFTEVERCPTTTVPIAGTQRAVFLDLDAGVATAGQSISENAVQNLSRRIHDVSDDGWLIFGLIWRPQIEMGSASVDEVDRELQTLQQRLGFPIPVSVCPHRGGPPKCWCRLPMPGRVIELCVNHSVDPKASRIVGDSAADKTLAERLRMEHQRYSDWLVES